VEDVFKRVTDEGYSFLLDGTFALASASKNIKRVLNKSYEVNIYFVYQDPLIAWKFVKEREIKEDRHVPKDIFINAYFMNLHNIIRAKEKFGESIEVTILFKDFHNVISETHADTNNIQLTLHKRIFRGEFRWLKETKYNS
jgi:predicted ABC-type ATPase